MTRFKAPNGNFHQLFHMPMDAEMLEVGLYQLFRNLGKSMLTLAIPFYLYATLGYEIWQVCVFYLCWQVWFVVLHPFAGYFMQHWGLKHCMAAMTVSSSIFWLAIPFMVQGDFVNDIWRMTPFFALRALGYVLFEVSYDIFLTHHMNRQAQGKVLAYLQIAVLMAALLAPILGAFLAATFGLQAATWAAVGFLLVAGGILLLTPDEKIKVPYSPKKLAIDTIKKTPLALPLSQLAWVFQDGILWIIWPIFLALIVKDLLSMSLLVGVASFCAMVVAYIMGRKIDKKSQPPKDLLEGGSIRGTIINLCRAVSFSPVVVLIIDFGYKVNWQSITVPHDNEVYKWLHEKDTYERSHIRWWIVETCYLIPLLLATGLFYIFDNEPQWLFILLFLVSGVGLLGTSQVTKLNKG